MMSLNFMEIGSVIVLSALTVLSGIMLFEFDKSYNTPLINTIFIKSIGALSIVFIGVVIFEESYSYANWLGILMIIIGLYLVMVKP